MSYAKLLHDLPVERLREIVSRRAATLRGIPRIGSRRALTEFLSEALSSPESIMEALNATDLLQVQTLIFLVVQSGTVSFDALAEEAGGETARRRMEEVVHGLESLGLALWTQQRGGRAVFIPPAVCQHTPIPLPFRFPLPRALKQYDAATITRMYENLGLPKGGLANRGARTQAILQTLTSLAELRALVARLSAEARKILDFVAAQGGVTTLVELGNRMDARRRNQLFSYGWSQRWAQGESRNEVEELLAHGLLVLEGYVGWGYGRILIPGDVLHVLTGRSFFPDGVGGPPRLETPSTADSAFQQHGTLCRDITYLFGFLGRAEAGRTAKGNIYRNVLKNVAKGLTIPTPEYAGFLYALCRETEMIAPQGPKSRYDMTANGSHWLEQPSEAQTQNLFDAWRKQMFWVEPAPDPLVDDRRYLHEEVIRAYRKHAITLLCELARENPDGMASFASMAAVARFRWWSLFPVRRQEEDEDMVEAETDAAVLPPDLRATVTLLRRICAGSLYWLGLTEMCFNAQGLPGAVRLSPLGRHILLGEERDGAAPPAADTFVVQPNLEIYAPPNLDPRLLHRLFRAAEPTGTGMLALSRESIRRALDRGETADDLLAFLRRHSQTGVPQNVEYLLNELGGRHGHIKIGQAGLYMTVSDPRLLQELRAQKGLKIHFREQLADTVALITGDSVDAILRQLRQAGYFPVAADGEKTAGQKAAPAPSRVNWTPSRRSSLMKRGGEGGSLKPSSDEIETRIDWAAIAAEGGAPWDEEDQNP